MNCGIYRHRTEYHTARRVNELFLYLKGAERVSGVTWRAGHIREALCEGCEVAGGTGKDFSEDSAYQDFRANMLSGNKQKV